MLIERLQVYITKENIDAEKPDQFKFNAKKKKPVVATSMEEITEKMNSNQFFQFCYLANIVLKR